MTKPNASRSVLEQARAGLVALEASVQNGRATVAMLEYARSVVAGLEALEASKAALAAVKTPAAFKGTLAQAPDTDASRAARGQRDRVEGRD